MSRCSFCDTSVGRKQGIFCSGPCKNLYHLECVKIPSELASHLSTIPGLQWRCNACLYLDNKLDEKKIQDLFERKCSELFTEFAVKFDLMKSELLQSALDKISDLPRSLDSNLNVHSHQPTYADKAARLHTSEKIAVKPKNPNQLNSLTKSDLLNVANPIDLNVKINKVKHIRNGGIVLDCMKSKETSTLKRIAEERLGADYDVHVLKSIHPQLKIVGFTENLDNDTLLHYIRRQNEDVIQSESECTVIRAWPTKKNARIYQATLQVDLLTYKKLLGQGHILVGLDSCAVYDAILVPRCFKCNNFYHTKNTCKNAIICPICAKDHSVESCTNGSKRECINCVNLKLKQKINVDTNHAVWEYGNCAAHKKAVEKLKSDLFGAQDK